MRPALVATLVVVAAGLAGCKVKDPPPVTKTWTDDFARDEIGGNYYKTGGGHEVTSGALRTKGSHNHPLWLRKKLPPKDIQIDVTAWSMSPEGDIKVEVFGDGRSFDPDGGGYTSSGYVFIFGGWGNTKSMIARGNEHGSDLVERTQPRVVPGQRYHFRIVRKLKDKKLLWYIDDMTKPFLEYADQRPLQGVGHEYFAFNNWESDSWFDDLTVTPL
jgi:hypothetical protein